MTGTRSWTSPTITSSDVKSRSILLDNRVVVVGTRERLRGADRDGGTGAQHSYSQERAPSVLLGTAVATVVQLMPFHCSMPPPTA